MKKLFFLLVLFVSLITIAMPKSTVIDSIANKHTSVLQAVSLDSTQVITYHVILATSDNKALRESVIPIRCFAIKLDKQIATYKNPSLIYVQIYINNRTVMKARHNC